MYIVTDTHPWVWFLTASQRLSQKAKSVLSDTSNLIIVPSIVMMEIKYLYQHKRITISFEEALQHVETSENILLHPLDMSVVTKAPRKIAIKDLAILQTCDLPAILRYRTVFSTHRIGEHTARRKNCPLPRLAGNLQVSPKIKVYFWGPDKS